MQTVSVKVYEFNELSERVQERLKEQAAEFLTNMNFDQFNDWAPEWLKAEFGIDAKIYYSLSYCQGDGIHFITDDFLTEQVIKKLSLTAQTMRLLNRYKEEGYKVVTRHNGNCHYEYATPKDVEFDDDFENSLTPKQAKTFEEVKTAASELYMDICRKLEQQGNSSYDIEEKDVVDYLSQNLYYRDGRAYDSED